MLTEKDKSPGKTQTSWQRLWPWLNMGLTAVLLLVGLWYLFTKIPPAELAAAFTLSQWPYVLIGLTLTIVINLLKAWRWQFLLTTPDTSPPDLSSAFWAVTLGFFVNLVLPFLRLGEFARVYALWQQTGISKTRGLGTVVVEKTLELLMIAGTAVFVVTAIVIPDTISNSTLLLGLVGLIGLLVMYLLAFQTQRVNQWLHHLTNYLPTTIANPIHRLILNGLEGLSALRNRKLTAGLVATSLAIAILYILTPFVLFPAFGLSYGLAEAALIHIVVSIAATPPSTPGKIGVFDGTTALMLASFGLENTAVIAGYTILYRVVVMLPQIVLGAIAASRTHWQWRIHQL